MTNQLKAPKKPFPVAGIFLILFGLFSMISNIASFVSYMSKVLPYVYEWYNPLYIVDVVLSYAMPIIIGFTGIILGIVLLAKKSGAAVSVFTIIYTILFGAHFLVILLSSGAQLINNIDIFISYEEISFLLNAIINVCQISKLASAAFALLLISIIALMSHNPKRCRSFIVRCWIVPLLFFIFAFISSGTVLILNIAVAIIEEYSPSVYLSLIPFPINTFLEFLAHLFLAIWFGRLAAYRRKLQAYEAAMPIETAASEVTEAPVPAVEPAPVPEPVPVAEAAAEVESAQPATVSEPEVTPSVIGEIQRLKQLLDTGAITEEQFEVLKTKLIGQ